MRRLVVLTALWVALCAGPAHALAPGQVFGIGNTTEFGSPKLKELQPGATRLLTPWNAALKRGYERDRVDHWYRAALNAGLDPLLSFQGTRTGKAPTVTRFTKAFKAALRRWPNVGEWQTWNEANHSSQPEVYSRPRLAARYALAMEATCAPRCTVIPVTVVIGKRGRLNAWLSEFLDAYGKTPRIWAVHNYGDINRRQDRRVRHFLEDYPDGRVWITETGAFKQFATEWPPSLSRQRRLTPLVFEAALKYRDRIDRLYWWSWRGTANPDPTIFDSGLANSDGTVRPAYRTALDWRFRTS